MSVKFRRTIRRLIFALLLLWGVGMLWARSEKTLADTNKVLRFKTAFNPCVRDSSAEPFCVVRNGKPEFSFDFVRKTEYFVPLSLPASDFSSGKINIYGYDLTTSPDTFCFSLQKFAFPVKGKPTSGYGPRNLFGSHFHHGMDLGLLMGDSVRAVMDGTVRLTKNDPRGYGNFVVVAHEGGLETLYGHLSQILVEPGARVRAGQSLGLGGSTGRSTGPHLHFEFRLFGMTFDPARIVDFKTGRVKTHHAVIDKSWFCQYKSGCSHEGKQGLKNESDEDEEMTEAEESVRFHVVKAGDGLEALAIRYNTDLAQLCRLNALPPNASLRPGQRIKLPH
ncbi:MAG: M23 family metallopeptidase [Bacteroidia bacterium]|nr:M23 family metallopeptidase [Bacteroidia bacterium]